MVNEPKEWRTSPPRGNGKFEAVKTTRPQAGALASELTYAHDLSPLTIFLPWRRGVPAPS